MPSSIAHLCVAAMLVLDLGESVSLVQKQQAKKHVLLLHEPGMHNGGRGGWGRYPDPLSMEPSHNSHLSALVSKLSSYSFATDTAPVSSSNTSASVGSLPVNGNGNSDSLIARIDAAITNANVQLTSTDSMVNAQLQELQAASSIVNKSIQQVLANENGRQAIILQYNSLAVQLNDVTADMTTGAQQINNIVSIGNRIKRTINDDVTKCNEAISVRAQTPMHACMHACMHVCIFCRWLMIGL